MFLFCGCGLTISQDKKKRKVALHWKHTILKGPLKTIQEWEGEIVISWCFLLSDTTQTKPLNGNFKARSIKGAILSKQWVCKRKRKNEKVSLCCGKRGGSYRWLTEKMDPQSESQTLIDSLTSVIDSTSEELCVTLWGKPSLHAIVVTLWVLRCF